MTTNNAWFVDTSGWAAYFDRDDPHHAEVTRLIADAIGQRRGLVTTDYIIAELVSLFTSRHLRMSHAQMVTDITLLKSEPSIQITYIEPDRAEKAWELIVARSDKDWSLVDASSFVVMRELDLFEAVATDHHFEQAGFIRLP